MKDTSDSNHAAGLVLPQRAGRNFDYCISALVDEIQLAIHWGRPSILLAINPSTASREKAQQELRRRLSTCAKSILPIGPGQDWTSLFQFLAQAESPDHFIYLVDGLGRVEDSYRALNLRREQIVEQKLIVLFWLTPQEAKELPAAAPDFWAFRHRVIEFGSSRGSRRQSLPSGLMIWQQDNPFLFYKASVNDIAAVEELLQMLPVRDDAIMMRADAIYRLAGLYWVFGETQRATALLQEQVDLFQRLGLPDLSATFQNGQAIILYDQGFYDEAVAKLESALEKNAKDPVLLSNLAIALFAIGRTTQSVKLLQRAIRSSATSAWLLYILGHIQLVAAKPEDADTSFQAAMRLDSVIPYPRYAAVVCRTRMGDHVNEAVNKYLRGLDPINDGYHALYMQTLLEGVIPSFDTLRSAVKDGSLSPLFVKRDPIFNLLLDGTVRGKLLET